MIEIKKIIEIIQEPILKVRAIDSSGDYVEIKLEDGWLDVRAGKDENSSLRTLYRDNDSEGLTFAEIINKLNIIYLWGNIYEENYNN